MTQTYLDSYFKKQKEPKKEKSKPKKYLSSNKAFWMEPEELKKLMEEFEVIFV